MRLVSERRGLATLFAVSCLVGMASQADAQSAATTAGETRDSPPSHATAAEAGTGEIRVDRPLSDVHTGWRFIGTAAALEGQPGSAQPTRPRDSVLNGVLIGAGIGALLGLIPDYYDDCEECHDSLYASIAVGAGIGLLVDALRNSRPAVAPSQSGKPLELRLAMGRGRIAFGGLIRWR